MSKITIPLELAQFTANALLDMVADPHTLSHVMGNIIVMRIKGGVVICNKQDKVTIENHLTYWRELREENKEAE